jgi:hypothetical protein
VVIASMVVGEAGCMLGSVALTIVATSRLGDQHAGLAAGLINTSTQLGGGFGLGIVATVAAATASQAAVDPNRPYVRLLDLSGLYRACPHPCGDRLRRSLADRQGASSAFGSDGATLM